jgi:hypothetical protein
LEAEPGGGFGECAFVAGCAVVGGVDEFVQQADEHGGRVAFLGAEEDVVDAVGAGAAGPALAEDVFAFRAGAVAESDGDVQPGGGREADLGESGPECFDRPVQSCLTGNALVVFWAPVLYSASSRSASIGSMPITP